MEVHKLKKQSGKLGKVPLNVLLELDYKTYEHKGLRFGISVLSFDPKKLQNNQKESDSAISSLQAQKNLDILMLIFLFRDKASKQKLRGIRFFFKRPEEEKVVQLLVEEKVLVWREEELLFENSLLPRKQFEPIFRKVLDRY